MCAVVRSLPGLRLHSTLLSKGTGDASSDSSSKLHVCRREGTTVAVGGERLWRYFDGAQGCGRRESKSTLEAGFLRGAHLEGFSNFEQSHQLRDGLISTDWMTLPPTGCHGEKQFGRRVFACHGQSSFTSSPGGWKIHKQRGIHAHRKHGHGTSRKLKIGLIYRLFRFGGATGGGNEGGEGGDGGHGWGDGSGGGGDGGDEVNYPSPSGGGFNFFTAMLLFLREIRRRGVESWGPPAFLAWLLIATLEWNDYAHAKTISDASELAIEEKATIISGEKEGAAHSKDSAGDAIWVVKGSKWNRYIVDLERDEFVFDVAKPNAEEAKGYERVTRQSDDYGRPINKFDILRWISNAKRLRLSLHDGGVWARELVRQVFLPAGFPESVTEGYVEFTSWRLGQIIASQVSGVLTTQALLYAVGLGKGAIPTAAAVNWVLKDGVGYLSKILLSKYGRQFDVHPKGWRLVSDIIENASYGLELVTPLVPQFFVYLAAAAGAGRSAAGLIQAATKSSFNANFAAQRNFAEIIAKGEAQGMASKSVGIGLGILISGYVGSQGPLLVLTFGIASALHIFFNLKSYQAVHLRTLNPYRASLVLAEYLKNGKVPSVIDVNAEEPIFFGVPWFDPKPRKDQGYIDTVSPESKAVASLIEKNVDMGVSIATVVRTKGEADALLELYSKDKYLLCVQPGDKIKVVLKEGAGPRDMLKAMVQAVYLNIIDQKVLASGNLILDCSRGGILQITHEFMEKNFDSITQVLSEFGWVSDGVLAKAASNRLFTENQTLYPFAVATA